MLSKSGQSIINFLNPNTSLVLIFTIQFFVTFQLGKLFTIYNSRKISKFVGNFIKITIFLVLLFLLIGLPANIEKFGLLEGNYMMWAILGGVFVMLTAGLIGFNSEEDKKADALGIIGIVIFIVLAIGLLVLMLYIGVDKHSWLLGILVFIGGLILLGFLLFRISLVFEKFENIKVPKPIKISSKIVFIILSALSIIIWQSIHIYANMKFSIEFDGYINTQYLIFSLILTGILPFRLLWAFSEPGKIFSIISGVLFIAIDIYSIVNI